MTNRPEAFLAQPKIEMAAVHLPPAELRRTHGPALPARNSLELQSGAPTATCGLGGRNLPSRNELARRQSQKPTALQQLPSRSENLELWFVHQPGQWGT